MDRFRSNFWRRIRIRNHTQPITSGFWDIWGYVLEKWGFSLLLRLCTERKKFVCFLSQMSSLSTTLPLQDELLNSQERFLFTKMRPYTTTFLIVSQVPMNIFEVFFVKKNRSWLFNSSFWRERVVLNDDIWERNQTNFLRSVHNLKSSEKPHFSST